jgi:hypothetical protein
MKQVRCNVFETNSSSTHSMVLINVTAIEMTLINLFTMMGDNTDNVEEKLGDFFYNYFNYWDNESPSSFIKDFMCDDYIEDVIKDNKEWFNNNEDTEHTIINTYQTFDNYLKVLQEINITCHRINDENFVLNENGVLFHVQLIYNAVVDGEHSTSYVQIQYLTDYKKQINNILRRIKKIESEK